MQPPNLVRGLINYLQIVVNMNKQQPSLAFCIIMDVLGYATYAIPGLGELGDIVFAPISAIVFMPCLAAGKALCLILRKSFYPVPISFRHLPLCGSSGILPARKLITQQ